jgi:hypothetical protein
MEVFRSVIIAKYKKSGVKFPNRKLLNGNLLKDSRANPALTYRDDEKPTPA